jgi:hypothetical protein
VGVGSEQEDEDDAGGLTRKVAYTCSEQEHEDDAGGSLRSHTRVA